MFFTRSLVLIVLACLSLVTPAPAVSKRWFLTGLNIESLDGFMGEPDQTTLTANITNPNTISVGPAKFPPSSANCSIIWQNTIPFGQTFPCQSNSDVSSWSCALHHPGTSIENFTLSFTLRDSRVVDGNKYKAVYGNSTHFTYPQNLEGTCAANGNCFFAVDTTPYFLQQKKES